MWQITDWLSDEDTAPNYNATRIDTLVYRHPCGCSVVVRETRPVYGYYEMPTRYTATLEWPPFRGHLVCWDGDVQAHVSDGTTTIGLHEHVSSDNALQARLRQLVHFLNEFCHSYSYLHGVDPTSKPPPPLPPS